ncbi:hypothetical protein [Achromobacter anxifer]|uniref:hypothetical protein n=1 Tax=Achromobacter anxifer TaxID=1287737 RepID=UPI0023F9DEE8|nr:hypothetical protein [Achromobacter anxifer]MDF8364695.1 hypothetical protein [Achromobacter anxifer]
MQSHALSLFRIFALVGLVLALGLSAGLARGAEGGDEATFAERCAASLPAIELHFSARPAVVVLSTKLDVPTLTTRTAVSARERVKAMRGGETPITVGLTESRFFYQSAVRTSSMKDPASGLHCARIGAEMVIVTGPQTVHIARDIRKDSCAYNEVLHHEMRHVRANQAIARDVAAGAERRFRGRHAAEVMIGTSDELMVRFQRIIAEQWIPEMEQMARETAHVHDDIDTPEEYQRIQDVCGGEVAAAINGRVP